MPQDLSMYQQPVKFLSDKGRILSPPLLQHEAQRDVFNLLTLWNEAMFWIPLTFVEIMLYFYFT